MTHSVQWFERTLDDSANRRIGISESFLAIDAILELLYNITDGLVVYERMINKRVMEELPFMATENIIMESVKRGADRQEMHEVIRVNSMEAGKRVKMEGLSNDLLDRLAADKAVPLNKDEIMALLNPIEFVGRAPEQVDQFIGEEVNPVLEKYEKELGMDVDIKV